MTRRTIVAASLMFAVGLSVTVGCSNPSSETKAAAQANNFLFENGLIKTKIDTTKIFDDRFVKAYAARKRA